MEFINKLFNIGNEQGDWEPFFEALESKPKMGIQALSKRFTDTAKWLSAEVNSLIEYYKVSEHKDAQRCITYLERMLSENFCIRSDDE